MDKIVMSRMEFYGYHGVLSEENMLGQRFYVDLELFLELKKSGESDNILDTVNYADVYLETKQIVEGRSYKLIEAVAENIASHLLDTYTVVNGITVRLTKPHPPFDIHFAGVTVEIHRKRN